MATPISSSDLSHIEQLDPLPYPVYFVNKRTERWQDLMTSDRLPPMLDPYFDRCSDGYDIWSTQTYIYLKQRGLNVYLIPEIIPNRICVVPYHHLMIRDLPFRSYIVACRLDSARPEICEQQTVLNNQCVKTSTDHFIPQWPQPNLKPRDRSRESKVENLAFKGDRINLAEPFKTPEFTQQLIDLGICFTQSPEDPTLRFQDWSDYSNVDVVLAVRDVSVYDLALKPAAKLINAWFAGCPAILGPETAFQELRRSELDYIEVRTPDEVIAALRRLKENPNLYTAMIENGFKRAQEFTPNTIAQRWRDVLAEPIAEGYERWMKQSPAQKLIGRPTQFVRRCIRHKREEKQYWQNVMSGPRLLTSA